MSGLNEAAGADNGIGKGPGNAATKRALNRKAQGGDTCGFLGFPSSGHAHQTQRDIAGLTFIGSRTLSVGKHPRAR